MDPKDFELVQQVMKAAAGEGETALLAAVQKAFPELAGKELAAAVSAYRALAGFGDNPVLKKAAEALTATLKGENPFAEKPKGEDEEPEEDEEVEMKKGLPEAVVKSLEPLPKEQRVAAFKALRAGQETAEKERIAKADEQVAIAKREAAEAKAKAEKTEALFKAEQDKTRSKEFIAKAEKELQHLPGKADELGGILKSLEDVDPKLCARVETVFKAAAAALEQGGLFIEKGKAGESPGESAEDAIAKAAEKHQEQAAK